MPLTLLSLCPLWPIFLRLGSSRGLDLPEAWIFLKLGSYWGLDPPEAWVLLRLGFSWGLDLPETWILQRLGSSWGLVICCFFKQPLSSTALESRNRSHLGAVFMFDLFSVQLHSLLCSVWHQWSDQSWGTFSGVFSVHGHSSFMICPVFKDIIHFWFVFPSVLLRSPST
jgi:hypothetical protein